MRPKRSHVLYYTILYAVYSSPSSVVVCATVVIVVTLTRYVLLPSRIRCARADNGHVPHDRASFRSPSRYFRNRIRRPRGSGQSSDGFSVDSVRDRDDCHHDERTFGVTYNIIIAFYYRGTYVYLRDREPLSCLRADGNVPDAVRIERFE